MTREPTTEHSDARKPGGEDLGGDPVCWLDRVCPECGAFLPDGPEHPCPRCAG
jgi:hypothetical protein